MNFKLAEIVVIFFALAIPVVLFGLMLTPGAWDSVVGYVLAPQNRWTVFGGGAGAVALVLVWRVLRRFGAKDAPQAPPAPQLSDFFWRSRRK